MKRTFLIISGLVVLALIAVALQSRYRHPSTGADNKSDSEPTQSTQESLKPQSGQLVVATAESNGYVYYYFDLATKQLVATRRDANQTGLSNGGYSITENEK